MKTFFLIAEDAETVFCTESIQELKQEMKMKHWDDCSECFLIQVQDDQVLDLQFWELFVGIKNSEECFESASEVLTEDDYCLLDKGYILKH